MAVILMDTVELLDAEAMRRTCKACKTSSRFGKRLIQWLFKSDKITIIVNRIMLILQKK